MRITWLRTAPSCQRRITKKILARDQGVMIRMTGQCLVAVTFRPAHRHSGQLRVETAALW
jgi:hypothetical protein